MMYFTFHETFSVTKGNVGNKWQERENLSSLIVCPYRPNEQHVLGRQRQRWKQRVEHVLIYLIFNNLLAGLSCRVV